MKFFFLNQSVLMQKLVDWFASPLCEATWTNQLIVYIFLLTYLINVPIGPSDTDCGPIWWKEFGASQWIINWQETTWFFDVKKNHVHSIINFLFHFQLFQPVSSCKTLYWWTKTSAIKLASRSKKHELHKTDFGDNLFLNQFPEGNIVNSSSRFSIK